jgi:phosphoglycolate phosphatase-like HAD superfamily hydrolase
MIRAVVFDFDGVIVESAGIKTRAFEALFAETPSLIPAIREYHLREAGISRHVKIHHIRTKMLGLPFDSAAERALAERFGDLVEVEVMRAPLVPGAAEFLARPSARPYFIASGTPETELRRIADARGLTPAFAGVFGSPTPKPEILRAILAAHIWQPWEVAFVGDGESDRDAALETGVPFIARVHAEGTLTEDGWWLRDLTELDARLAEIERSFQSA